MEIDNLQTLADNIRIEALKMVTRAKASHIGGALSMADILAVLYGKYMQYDPSNPDWPGRDRLILSKGHCCTTLYAVLALTGFYPLSDLNKYGEKGSYFLSHISSKIPGVEFSSGSLGHGLPYACGLAYAARLKNESHRIYCIVGDGEMQEGSNWEALLFASHHKLSNICLFIDYNKIQAMGFVENILNLESLTQKLTSFGIQTYSINGNSISELVSTLDNVLFNSGDSPIAIIANTQKGAGVSFMEDKLKWHYSNPTPEELETAILEIKSR